MTKENKGYIYLIEDLRLLLKEAEDFEFDDFRNEKYATPKLELMKQFDTLKQNVMNGKYDQ